MTTDTRSAMKVADDEYLAKFIRVVLIAITVLVLPVWFFFIRNLFSVLTPGHPQDNLWYQQVASDELYFTTLGLGVLALVLTLLITIGTADYNGAVAGVAGCLTALGLILVMTLSFGYSTNVDKMWVKSQLSSETGQGGWQLPIQKSRYGPLEETLGLNPPFSEIATNTSTGEQVTVHMVPVGENLWKLEYEPVAR